MRDADLTAYDEPEAELMRWVWPHRVHSGVYYCVEHGGICNEDENWCDQSCGYPSRVGYDEPEPWPRCRLMPLLWDPPSRTIITSEAVRWMAAWGAP